MYVNWPHLMVKEKLAEGCCSAVLRWSLKPGSSGKLCQEQSMTSVLDNGVGGMRGVVAHIILI